MIQGANTTMYSSSWSLAILVSLRASCRSFFPCMISASFSAKFSLNEVTRGHVFNSYGARCCFLFLYLHMCTLQISIPVRHSLLQFGDRIHKCFVQVLYRLHQSMSVHVRACVDMCAQAKTGQTVRFPLSSLTVFSRVCVFSVNAVFISSILTCHVHVAFGHCSQTNNGAVSQRYECRAHELRCS